MDVKQMYQTSYIKTNCAWDVTTITQIITVTYGINMWWNESKM